MAKRVVRALGLIFGCVFAASLVHGLLSDATLLFFSQSMPSSPVSLVVICLNAFWLNCPLLIFSGLYSSY
jgi:hypothetical protein